MTGKPRLQLKPEPDGYGYLYGQVLAPDGGVYRVDIMPPVPHWRGDTKLGPDLPHPTDWIVFVDGDEIARVARREDLEGTLATLRLKHKG